MHRTRYRRQVEEAIRAILESALRLHGNNRTHAAAWLGMPRPYLVRLLRRHKVTG